MPRRSHDDDWDEPRPTPKRSRQNVRWTFRAYERPLGDDDLEELEEEEFQTFEPLPNKKKGRC
jgi:hypothetical protein